jgi:hypothetical protein
VAFFERVCPAKTGRPSRPSARGIDFRSAAALLPRVPALRRLVAVLLLSLWLPATLHCALEAAGLEIALVCHDHATQSASANHCEDDACHAIEGEAYTAVALTKLVGDVSFSIVAVLPEPLELHPAGISPESTDVPRELRPSWQFSTRAAPPARAPSAIV